MYWEIGQVMAVDMRHNLHAQYHIRVQLDDSCYHIYYLHKLVSFALSQNGEEWVGQPVVVDIAF